ncbi:MAG: CarD family transcriptional regulator [Ruminococcus sp.]|nr:CarD family transcriptional regulator [Ruminococcus sp.]
MNLNIGDIAIYGCMGICRFEGTEKRCFNGIDENDYYKFVPVKGIGNNTYYIPASSSDEKIRNLLSEKYVYNVLNKISDIEPLEINQLTNIRQFVEQSVKEGNYENIISILKYMHNKKCTYSVNGKK